MAAAPTASADETPLMLAPEQLQRIVERVNPERIDAYLAEIAALGPRAVGASGLPRTAQWLEERLPEIGLEVLAEQDFFVTSPVDKGSSITWGNDGGEEQSAPIFAMWPNLAAAPFCPPEGHAARLAYVGKGTIADFDGIAMDEDTYVLMDYDSGSHWETAAMLGAQGVIYLPAPNAVQAQNEAKFADVPLQFPRYYLDDARAARALMTRVGDAEPDNLPIVHVKGGMEWRDVRCRNLLALLPASETADDPETVLLSVRYDAGSVAPAAAPGGMSAANLAAAMAFLEYLALDLPRSQREAHLMVLFDGAQSMSNSGARAFAAVLRDIKAQRRLDLLESGATPNRQQTLLLDKLARSTPWMDERRRDFNIQSGRLQAAIDWLQKCRDGAQPFAYRDEEDVEVSLIVRFREADEWLLEDLKDQIKQQQIVTIVETGQLEAEHGIDMFTPEGQIPERVLSWRLKREYYKALDDQASLEGIAEVLHSYEVPEELLDTQDVAFDNLIRGFRQDLEDLRREFASLQSDLALRDVLREFRITRNVALSLSAGNSIVTFDLSRKLGGHYDEAAAMEWAWSLGPLTSQVVEGIAAAANRALDGAEPFHFVDSVTFNAARKLQVAPAEHYEVNVAFSQGGTSPLTLITGNDTRIHLLGPGDRVRRDPEALENLSTQGRTAALAMAHLLLKPGLVPYLERNIADVLTTSGKVVVKDVRSGPFPRIPIKDAIAVLPASNRASSDIFLHRYAISGRDGGFRFEWLPKGVTDIYSEGRTSLEALKFSPTRGTVTHAIDANMRSRGGYSTYVSLYGNDVFRRLVVFDGAPVALYGLNDPLLLRVLTSVSVHAQTGGGLEYQYMTAPETTESSFTSAVGLFPNDATLKFLAGGRMFLLGTQDVEPEGLGYNIGDGLNLIHTPLEAAVRLHNLNGYRLGLLNAKGIRDTIAERLHAQSQQDVSAMDAAVEAHDYSRAYSLASRIWGKELRAYPQVKGKANQAVVSVVLLLALLAPWSVFLERITFQSGSINKRLAGGALFFGAGFLLIYNVHPAFQISTAPVIILVAYALAGLALLSLSVIMQRYTVVMKRWRERVGGIHSSDISRASAFAVAFNLGLTNLAKRPLRTGLTIVMIALLAFSVITFTSVDTYLDTRFVPIEEGDETGFEGVMFRQMAWLDIPETTAENFERTVGEDALTVRRLWYVNREDPWAIGLGVNKFVFTRPGSEQSFTAEALLGFMEEEAAVSDLPRFVTGSWFTGARNEVILPRAAADSLGISDADVTGANEPPSVIYGSIPLRVVGILDAQTADDYIGPYGEPLTHLDFFRSGWRWTGEVGSESGIERLSFDRSMLLSYQLLKELDGKIKTIAARFPEEVDGRERVEAIMSRLDANLFAAVDGSSYLVKSARNQSVTGLWKVFLPVVLVVLIIVNTMLGAVDERTEEIKMLGAVGLAPRHVSILYLAESTVYGVLGVTFGVMLGLLVGLATRQLEMQVDVNYASVSTMLMGLAFMCVVVAATLIPASRAARLATPSGASEWSLEDTGEEHISLTLPFTMTRDNGVGIFAFLHEYMEGHSEPTSADFCCSDLEGKIEERSDGETVVALRCRVWLAPYDMRVGQHLLLELRPAADASLFTVHYRAARFSGELDAWRRANFTFIDLLRQQFLIYRTLPEERKDHYLEKSPSLFLYDADQDAAPAVEGAAHG